MEAKVSLARCETYDRKAVKDAITRILDSSAFPDPSGKTVFLKPNMLSAKPAEAAVTTNPEVLRAVIEYAKERGAAKVIVGDSPGFQSQKTVARVSGLQEAAESSGAVMADFTETVSVDSASGKRVKSFRLSKEAMDADILVSMAKLKTHTLMRYTGAVKNLFGLVPGLEKSRFHVRFPERHDFGIMLADLLEAASPDFAVMDGIDAMEGPGPGSGTPVRMCLLGASKSCAALDAVCADAMGYDPSTIEYLTEAALRESADGILTVIDGPVPSSFRQRPLDLIREPHSIGSLKRKVPSWLYEAFESVFLPTPVFSRTKCTGCALCVGICPAKVLSLAPSKPGAKPHIDIDRKNCVRCYCCHEICPSDAISVRKFP